MKFLAFAGKPYFLIVFNRIWTDCLDYVVNKITRGFVLKSVGMPTIYGTSVIKWIVMPPLNKMVVTEADQINRRTACLRCRSELARLVLPSGKRPAWSLQ